MQGKIFTKESLNAKIDKSQDCWLWLGIKDKDGYGKTWYRGRGNISVHRLMYELYVAEIDPGMLILHSINCISRACVNPAHLRQGTHADNMADVRLTGSKKGSKNPNAKLTEYQVRKIRGMHLAGDSVRELARTFNVARRTIHNIIKGYTWADLEGTNSSSIESPTIEGVLELGESVSEFLSDESDAVSVQTA